MLSISFVPKKDCTADKLLYNIFVHREISKNYITIKRVLITVLALNWIVAGAKILFGLISRSASMTADGFHSLSDGASNIIGIIGIHLAAQPKDNDHPYGHKKYETFYALGIAFLLFLVALGIMHESLGRFTNPVPVKIGFFSFAVMFLTIVVNLYVMRYEKKKGTELKSDILISDSMHTRADIFTSLSVLAAFISVKIGYPLLDPVISIVISVFIAFCGYKIMRESSNILCDAAAVNDVKPIIDAALKIEGVKSCHKVRTRGRPDDIYVDLHVEVDGKISVDTAHGISYAIEDSIKKSLSGITDVVVHIEPKK